MKTYEEILKAKIDYYGRTEAAYQFAAEEFSNVNVTEQLRLHIVTLSLREQLIERYSALLTKNYKYQMGDDDFALTTEELRICRPLNIILQDLKN